MDLFCQTHKTPRQALDVISNWSTLRDALPLAGDPVPEPTAAIADFAMRVPRAFVQRAITAVADDPLVRQFLPTSEELVDSPGFVDDPVDDLCSTPIPGLIQKYQGRALLLVARTCAIHCRYCFRRHFPFAEHQLSAKQLDQILAFLWADPSISEVILSGGDPLTLSNNRLAGLFQRLGDIPHLRRIRVHSRVPVVLPQRLDPVLEAIFEKIQLPVVVVVHANHHSEIDQPVRDTLRRLGATGVVMLNQSVLLRGVNDSVDTLADLSETLMDCGVLPYYLHQLDPVAGASHFQVSDAEAVAIHREMQLRLPGYLVPRLVRDIPGTGAKEHLGRYPEDGPDLVEPHPI